MRWKNKEGSLGMNDNRYVKIKLKMCDIYVLIEQNKDFTGVA